MGPSKTFHPELPVKLIESPPYPIPAPTVLPLTPKPDMLPPLRDYPYIPAMVTEKPTAFHVSPPFPNPFNPITTLRYTLDEGSTVEISIYNISGVKIAHVVQEQKYAGKYSFTWDTSHKKLSSGVYLYRITAADRTVSGKMVLMK